MKRTGHHCAKRPHINRRSPIALLAAHGQLGRHVDGRATKRDQPPAFTAAGRHAALGKTEVTDLHVPPLAKEHLPNSWRHKGAPARVNICEFIVSTSCVLRQLDMCELQDMSARSLGLEYRDHIARLEVTMRNLQRVQVRHRRGDLGGDHRYLQRGEEGGRVAAAAAAAAAMMCVLLLLLLLLWLWWWWCCCCCCCCFLLVVVVAAVVVVWVCVGGR